MAHNNSRAIGTPNSEQVTFKSLVHAHANSQLEMFEDYVNALDKIRSCHRVYAVRTTLAHHWAVKSRGDHCCRRRDVADDSASVAAKTRTTISSRRQTLQGPYNALFSPSYSQ
jgi:hypothetical protein